MRRRETSVRSSCQGERIFESALSASSVSVPAPAFWPRFVSVSIMRPSVKRKKRLRLHASASISIICSITEDLKGSPFLLRNYEYRLLCEYR